MKDVHEQAKWTANTGAVTLFKPPRMLLIHWFNDVQMNNEDVSTILTNIWNLIEWLFVRHIIYLPGLSLRNFQSPINCHKLHQNLSIYTHNSSYHHIFPSSSITTTAAAKQLSRLLDWNKCKNEYIGYQYRNNLHYLTWDACCQNK